MLPELHKYIRTHALLKPGERLGVAASGGADSVALLRALLELRSELGVVVSVVHVHHGIRGAEADADEQFVTQLATTYDLPLHVERLDVPAHSQREKMSLEKAARELRYEYFKRLLQAGVCDKIATAHTLDDQAETVLLRIVRGTGTRGLAAIPPFRNASPLLIARIVRPFLATRRSEVEDYLKRLKQPWREDSTNQDPKHLRNRVRHQLLPLLERDFNPKVREALVNLAEIARAEEQQWSVQLSTLRSLVQREGDTYNLQRVLFVALPKALQRRLLVQLADDLDLPIAFDDIELMLHIAANPSSEHEFEGGWEVASSPTAVTIAPKRPAPGNGTYDELLTVPGALDLPISLRLKVLHLQPAEATRYNSATLLAYDRLQLPLRVRNWQPGDRFWPAGSKQAEKLKRLFQEHHIPANARSSWPVVLSGETIVWVRDFPVAAGYEAHNSPAVLIEAVAPGSGETRQE